MNERTASARGERGEAGFSLLELLAVMAIMAALAAIATPNVWKRPPGGDLRASALDMASLMRAARGEAMKSGVARAVTVDLGAHAYWADGIARRRTFDRNLAVEAVMPQSAKADNGVGRFTFYPDGSASGGSVVLHDGDREAIVAVSWLTGAAEVKWQR